MKYLSIFCVVTFLLVMQSCTGIVASHNIVSEQRQVSSFSEVELSNFCNAVIEKDSVFSVSVSAPDNLMTHIKTDVNSGILKITTPDHINVNMNGESATVHIKMPDPLNKISISGSGNIDVLAGFSNLSNISISGSGNVNANVPFSPSSLTTHISGSGNMSLAGTSLNHTMSISGSGNIHSKDFVVSNASVSISGSGNVYTTANTTLNATISGSGNIDYWGTAAVTSNISGSGSIIHH